MTVGKTEAGGKEDDTANDDTDELCVVLVGCVEKTAGGDTQIFQIDQLRGRFNYRACLQWNATIFQTKPASCNSR